MSDPDIDDFDDEFADDDDAKMVEEAETSVRTRLSSLEKRRLIDNLLEEKRLAKALKDDLADDNDDDLDDDWDADWDDDEEL
ncbi:PA3496 family putative envelope integrity protein [Psychrobacter sp. 1U2]|uniref:PA3496 family putative envelope integrity protein n=1 Tax=unclassified Psychrobacter TaxID=196806 RepID=UPI003F460276